MAYRNHLPKKYLAIGTARKRAFEFRTSSRKEAEEWARGFISSCPEPRIYGRDIVSYNFGFKTAVAYDTVTFEVVYASHAWAAFEQTSRAVQPQGRLF